MSTVRWGLGGVALATLVMSAGMAQASGTMDWTGLRLGASFGVGTGAMQWDEFDLTIDDYEDLGTFGAPGTMGGIFAGYDLEVAPGMVFGVEAGLQFFNAEGSTTALTVGYDYEFRSLGAAYAGVRAGIEVAPRTLLYGRLAYASIHAQSSEAYDAQEAFLHGYQAAIGLETEVMENVTVHVEGSYTRAIEGLETTFDGDVFIDVYNPAHLAVSAGVSYRFGNQSRGPRIALAPLRSWTGVYGGAMIGASGSSTVNGFRETEYLEGPVSKVDPFIGIYAGANLQLGEQWVAGVEGEFTRYETSWDFVQDDGLDLANSDHKGQVSVRFGYLPNPDTLIYARAGWGAIHMNPDELQAEEGTESVYLQAISAGLGIETMINEHLLLRAEGLYTTAIEEYRFNNTVGNPLYAKPSAVEARVGAAVLF